MAEKDFVKWADVYKDVMKCAEYTEGSVGYFQWSVKPGRSETGGAYTSLRVWPTPIEIYGGPNDGAVECGGVLYDVGKLVPMFKEYPYIIFCGCYSGGHTLIGGDHEFGKLILDIYSTPLDETVKPTLVSDYRTHETWPKA